MNKIIGLILIIIGIFIPVGIKTASGITTYLTEVKVTKKISTNDYYAILEIPKISLKREIFPLNSNKNNVNKNLYLHPESIMPNSTSSNVIILGHSGNGYNAYFKDLYKLLKGDIIKLYYHEKIYNYKIEDIEYQNKTGELYLKKTSNNNLILITCTKNDKNKQTIYYANLDSIEDIKN